MIQAGAKGHWQDIYLHVTTGQILRFSLDLFDNIHCSQDELSTFRTQKTAIHTHGKVSCRTYRYRWLKWHIVTINNSDREETDTRTLSFAIAPTFAQPWESSKPFRCSSVYAAQMFAWTINGLTSFAVLSQGKLFRLNRKFLLPTKAPSSHNEHSLRGGEEVWGRFLPRRPCDFRITRAVSQSASSVLGDRKRCTPFVPLQEARARYPATSHDPSKQDNWDPGPLAVKPQRFH